MTQSNELRLRRAGEGDQSPVLMDSPRGIFSKMKRKMMFGGVA